MLQDVKILATSTGWSTSSGYAINSGHASTAGYATSSGYSTSTGNADKVDGKHASEFEPTLIKGNLTASSPLNQSGGSGAVIGTGVALTIDNATTSQKGAVQLSNSYTNTSTGLAVTEKALSDGLATKQGTLITGNMTAASPIVLDQTRQVIGGAVVLSHSTSTGYKHIPTAGSANQLLKNSGVAGTGAWGTVTENVGALGAVTTLNMSGQLTNTLATGASPFILYSSTGVTNLNADLLDGYHAAHFQSALTNPITGTGVNGQVAQFNGTTTLTSVAENTAFNKNFETSTGNIKADSSVSVGASGKIPHSDHVHPKFTVQEADISLSAGSAVDNANLTTHGFLDILPGGTTVFKRGDGAWASPASVTVPYAYKQEAFAYLANIPHTITHGFGTYPVIQAFDSSGYMLIPTTVQNTDINNVAITFLSGDTYTIVLTVGSPALGNYTAISGTYAILTIDQTVAALSGSFTETLPTAVGVKGKIYYLKNSGTGVVTVACTGGQTLDNSATQVLLAKDEITVQSNDSNWIIINYLRKFRQVEIDFGATPVDTMDVIITDGGINVNSMITGAIAYVAPVGKDLDELEFDAFDLRFAPGNGQCTLHITSLQGLVADKFFVNYDYN